MSLSLSRKDLLDGSLLTDFMLYFIGTCGHLNYKGELIVGNSHKKLEMAVMWAPTVTTTIKNSTFLPHPRPRVLS